MTCTHKDGGDVTANALRIDPELASLIPPLSREEFQRLEISLLEEGRCRDPLLVWKGHNILLDGHNRLQLCRKHDLPFTTTSIELPNRAAARAYLVGLQLGRRNLTREAAAYLRGKRYEVEKKSLGGDRRSAEAGEHIEHLKTAQRLAREYQVSAATIRRDEHFARAVDAIVEHNGAEARQLILSRDTGLTRSRVLKLAAMKPGDQKRFLQRLREQGKPPRRPGTAGQAATVTLPTDPGSLVAKLVQRLGRDRAAAIARLLIRHLRHKAEAEA